jgi:hypothetical protein
VLAGDGSAERGKNGAVEETKGEEDLLKWGKLCWLRGWSWVGVAVFGRRRRRC